MENKDLIHNHFELFKPILVHKTFEKEIDGIPYKYKIRFEKYPDSDEIAYAEYLGTENDEDFIPSTGDDISQEEANKLWNEYYNSGKYEIEKTNSLKNESVKSSNKYVQAFREAVHKLEETPIGYFPGDDYTSDEPYEYTVNSDSISQLKKACEYLYKVSTKTHVDNGSLGGNNDINDDARKVAGRCLTIMNEFFKAYDIDQVKNNFYDINPNRSSLRRNPNKSMDKNAWDMK